MVTDMLERGWIENISPYVQVSVPYIIIYFHQSLKAMCTRIEHKREQGVRRHDRGVFVPSGCAGTLCSYMYK